MSDFIIRDECAGDEAEIAAVITAAFASAKHSGGNEAAIVQKLRETRRLAFSYLTCIDDQIVGHLALSRVLISDGSRDWYGLGPVAVLPAFQNRGIGGQMIETAIAALRHIDARGCVVLGNPVFYARFGFQTCKALRLDWYQGDAFTVLGFDGREPYGFVAYDPAFFLAS